jgi:dGTP triphosphohydrolase
VKKSKSELVPLAPFLLNKSKPMATEDKTQVEDTAALKGTITKLRNEIDSLKSQLTEREEQEKLNKKSLSEQVAQLQQEKAAVAQQLKDSTDSLSAKLNQAQETFNQQLHRRNLENQLTRHLLKANPLPNYEDLLLGHVASQELSEETIPQIVSDLRTKYPAMFSALPEPSGDGATGSVSIRVPSNVQKQVSADQFFQHLDQIASGEITLK